MSPENKNNVDISGLNFAYFTTQTFLTSLVVQVLSLLVSIITARLLGPSGKGVVAVLLLYPTLLLTLGQLGLYRALTIHVGLKKYPFSAYPGTVIVFTILISVILSIVFIFLYFNFNSLFIQGVPFYLILIALGILPALVLTQNFSSILQAKMKVLEFNLVDIFRFFILLIFISVSLILLRLAVVGAVISYFFANTMGMFLVIYFVHKISPEKWHFSLSLLKELVADGAKLHIGIIANFMSLRIGVFMLDHYKQSSNVGFYSIAVSMAELLILIPMAIQTVFYSRVPQMLGDSAGLREKTMMIYKHTLFLLLITSLALAILVRPLIKILFGAPFLPSFAPFIVLLPGVFFLWLNNILVNYLVGMRKFLTTSAIASIGAVLNVILNIILIPTYGTAGAAWSSTITYFTLGFLSIIVFLKVSGHRLKNFLKDSICNKKDFTLYSALIKKALSAFNT